jgi:hypothetical protein
MNDMILFSMDAVKYVGYKTPNIKVVVNDKLENFGRNSGLINEAIPEFTWTYQVIKLPKEIGR